VLVSSGGAANTLVPEQQRPSRIMLGPFQVDVRTCRVLRDGIAIRLRNQAFHVLKVLAWNTGKYVDYEELLREAWDGRRVSRHTVASTVGAVRTALAECGNWISYKPKLGYCLRLPRSEDLIRTGWHVLNRCTPEGLDMAIQYFREMTQQEPSNAEGFYGLVRSYFKMLACGIGAPCDVYRRFQHALNRAVAVGGWTAQIHTDMAWGLWLVEGNFEEAQTHLDISLRADPWRASPHMCQALIHASHKRLDAALESLDRARLADPLQASLSASEILVRLCRYEWQAAVEAGMEAVKIHPYLHFERTYYAQALEFAGDIQEALAQYRNASVIAPAISSVRALEARCLARNGQRSAAIAIAEELKQIRASAYVDAYYMALVMDALGRREEAFQELERAIDEHSTSLYMLHVDPKMDDLRVDHSRFSAISAKLSSRRRCFDSAPAGIAVPKRLESGAVGKVARPNSPLFRRRYHPSLT